MENDFRNRVLAVVRRIPAGQTRSYAEVAAVAGRPRAWRAVGNILKMNHDLTVPCHRVIRADDRLGGYNRGPRQKASRLRREGAVWRQPGREPHSGGIFAENRV